MPLTHPPCPIVSYWIKCMVTDPPDLLSGMHKICPDRWLWHYRSCYLSMTAPYRNFWRPSNPVPQLPLSVYALIIDELSKDWDRPSLKNLSLTRKILQPLCQRQLFKTMIYRTRNVERLAFLSEVSPILITYIRNFNYSPLGDDDIELQFIQNLRRINTFAFSGVSGESDFLDFRALPRPLAMAILNIIHSPDLRWLCLYSVTNYPVQSLLHLGYAPNLGRLDIQDLRMDSHIPEPFLNIQGLHAPSAPLMEIHIRPRSSQSLPMLLGGFTSPAGNQPVFDFPAVRELYVDAQMQADADANKLLIQACTELDMLVCELDEDAFGITFEGFADSILSGPYQTLRGLEFYIPISWVEPNDSFGRIDEEVQQLSESHQLGALETLKITLDLQKVEPTADEAERICGEIEAWVREMDEILGQDPGFPSLYEVSISVYVACAAHRNFKSNENIKARIGQTYKAAAKKIRKECFDHLSRLGLNLDLNFEIDMKWDLTYWDLI